MNIELLRGVMKKAGLDAVVLFSPVNIRYFSKFYITDGAAVITPDRAVMFTDSRYIEAAKAQADEMEVAQHDAAHKLSGLIAEALSGCRTVGGEEMSLPHADWLTYEKKLGLTLTPCETIIKEIRAVKTPYELESIIAAQRIAETALDEVLGLIHPGMSERELAAELTYRMLLHGGEGNSFDPIAITGKRPVCPTVSPAMRSSGRATLSPWTSAA